MQMLFKCNDLMYTADMIPGTTLARMAVLMRSCICKEVAVRCAWMELLCKHILHMHASIYHYNQRAHIPTSTHADDVKSNNLLFAAAMFLSMKSV